MARLIILVILIILGTFSSFGETYNDFFNKIKENNHTIKIEEIKKTIAKKKYEKETILADTQDEKLKAEITYISAINTYRINMKNIHTTLFSLIANTFIVETEYKILEMERQIALLDYQYLKKIDDLVYVKGQDANEAFIEFKEKELAVLQAEWDKKEAFRQFHENTGREWDQTFLELAKIYSMTLIDENEWQKQSLTIKLAKLKSELAAYEFDSLPENASKFDVQIMKLEQDKIRLEYEQAVKESLTQYRTLGQEREFLLHTATLLQENSETFNKELAEAEGRYKKKLIPEKEILLKRIYSLTLKKNYYATLRSYISSIITLVSEAGKIPEDILK